jgi:hypothetical protein
MKFTTLGLSDDLLEASKSVLEGSKEYQDFFKSALKKFGVTSPAEFKSDEEKKKFFDYVDKNYTGKNEGKIKYRGNLKDLKNSNEIDEAKPSKKFIKLGDNAEKKNLRLAVEKINPKKQEQIIDLYNKLMDVKHGGPEFKKMKDQIAKLQKEEVVSEASRDYYKQVDALIDKHGNEKAFIYKSPKLNKIVKELKDLIKQELKSGFKDSKKQGETVIKQLQKLEVMGYEENIVMTNKQHSNFKFDGDTMFREEMAEIIMQDVILSYAIFGE